MNEKIVFNHIDLINLPLFLVGIALLPLSLYLFVRFVAKNKIFFEDKRSILRVSKEERVLKLKRVLKFMGLLVFLSFTLLLPVTAFTGESGITTTERELVETALPRKCRVTELSMGENFAGGNYYALRFADICGSKVKISDEIYKEIRIAQFQGQNKFEIWFNEKGELIAIKAYSR